MKAEDLDRILRRQERRHLAAQRLRLAIFDALSEDHWGPMEVLLRRAVEDFDRVMGVDDPAVYLAELVAINQDIIHVLEQDLDKIVRRDLSRAQSRLAGVLDTLRRL